MTLKIKVSKIKYVLLYGLLFLAAMNFQAKFFYFVYFSFFVILVMQKRLRIDRTAILYLCTCGIMALYNRNEGLLSMIRCFAPCCLYLVGLNLNPIEAAPGAVALRRSENRGYALLAAISAGSFAHYGMNFLYNLGTSMGRNTNDIWTGQRMAATGQNALACLMMGFAVSMLFLPRKKWHRLAAVGMIGLMLLYNLVLSTRTMLVIMAALIAIGVLYFWNHAEFGIRRMKLVSMMVLFVLGAGAAYGLNVGGIRDYLLDSPLFNRMGGSLSTVLDNDSRTNTKLMFLKNMYRYPFGGLHLRAKYQYAHDLLLDGYDEYGVVTFLLLIAILILGAVQVYRLLRKTTYSDTFKLALLLIYTAVLLEFTVEPIFAGMPWLFSCYCLVNGCVAGMNKSYDRSRRRSIASSQ